MKQSIQAVYLLVVGVVHMHAQIHRHPDQLYSQPPRFGPNSNHRQFHSPVRSSSSNLPDSPSFQHFSDGSQVQQMPDRPMFQRSPDSMGERPFYRMPVPSESKLAEADLKSIEALHAEQKQISEKIMAVRHTLSLLEVEMRDAQKELYELQQARRRNIAELTYVERHHRYHTFSGVRPIPEDATLLGPSDYRIIARDDQDKPDTESSPGKESSSEASDKVVIERPKFANTHSKKAVVKENPSIKQEEKLAEKEANESTTLIIEDTAVLKPAEGSLVVGESKEVLIDEVNSPKAETGSA
ncbi:Hypothetical protein NTJ_04762 [Nesidiocoris tenuis]|uniref:Uncharacterized protein n=1 Tax=Nesidiocoris tenuis TaxID=355587 RepID=A0ABN7AKL0_9HEMI|nr:Hypothetical protein NTJ_04762 [Nesidiocoris tenuis]